MYEFVLIVTSVVNRNLDEVKLNFDSKRFNAYERHKRGTENSGTAEVDSALISDDASAVTSTQEIQFAAERTNPFLTDVTLKIGPTVVAIWWETKTKLETNYTIDLTNVDPNYFTGTARNKRLKFNVEFSLKTEKQIDPLKERDDFNVQLNVKSVTRKQSFANVDPRKKYVVKMKVIYAENTVIGEPEEFVLSEDVGKSIAEANKKEPNIYPLQFDQKLKIAVISIAIWEDLKPSKEEESIRLIGNYTIDLENINEKFFTGPQKELNFKVDLQLVPDNKEIKTIQGGDDITLLHKKVKDTTSITRRVPFDKIDANEKYSFKLRVTYFSTIPYLKEPEEYPLTTDVLKSIEDANREIRTRTTVLPTAVTEEQLTVETNEPTTEEVNTDAESVSTENTKLESTTEVVTADVTTDDTTDNEETTDDKEVETESETRSEITTHTVTVTASTVDETETETEETLTTKSEHVATETGTEERASGTETNPQTDEDGTTSLATVSATASDTSVASSESEKSTASEATTVETKSEETTEESRETESPSISETSTTDELTTITVSESTTIAEITDEVKTDDETEGTTEVSTAYSITDVEDTTLSETKPTTQQVSTTEDSTTEVITENTEKGTDSPVVTFPPEPTTEKPSASTTEESSAPTTEESSLPTAEESSASTTEESSLPTTEESSASTAEESSAPTTEDSSAPETEEFSESSTKQSSFTATQTVTSQKSSSEGDKTTVTDAETMDVTTDLTSVSETNTEEEVTTNIDEEPTTSFEETTVETITEVSKEESISTEVSDYNTESTTVSQQTKATEETDKPETDPITETSSEDSRTKIDTSPTIDDTTKSETESTTAQSESTREKISTDVTIDKTTEESSSSTEQSTSSAETSEPVVTNIPTTIVVDTASTTDDSSTSEVTITTETQETSSVTDKSISSEATTSIEQSSAPTTDKTVSEETSEENKDQTTTSVITTVISEGTETVSETMITTDDVTMHTSPDSTATDSVTSEESIVTDESTTAEERITSEQSSTPLVIASTSAKTEKPSTSQPSPTTQKIPETTEKYTETPTTGTEELVDKTTSAVTDTEPVTTEAFVNFTEPFIKDVFLKIGVAKTRLLRPFPTVISFSYDLNANKLNEIAGIGRYRRSVLSEPDTPKWFHVTLEAVLKSIGQSGEITQPILHSFNMNEKDHSVKSSHKFNNLDPKKKYEASLKAVYHTKIADLPDNEVVLVSSDVVKDIEKSNEPKTKSAPPEDNSWKIAAGSVAGAALLIILIAIVVVRNNKRKLKHTVNSKNSMRNGSLLDNSLSTLPRGAISLKEYPKNGYDNEAFQEDPNSRSSTLSGNHFVVTKYSLPINVAEFNTVYKSLKDNSFAKICDEFKKVKQITETKIIALSSQRNGRMTNNRLKNRFANIVPYDHSRVKLTAVSDTLGSDYINANYIPGFSSKKEYIATQGPLRKTLIDFWRMICEQNISVIVNLTQSMEGDIVKCETYWPTLFENGAEANLENGSSQPTLTVGSYRITLKSETNVGNFTIRDLEVSSPKKTFVVKQYHLTQWPDFQSPRNPRYLLNLIKSVRKHVDEKQLDNDTQTAPILVHCSAGVGRTGTFIAVDRLYQELVCRSAPQIDVFGTVMDMRQHRVHMVQTEDQYIFIYECIAALIDEINGSNTITSKSSKGSVKSYPSLPRAATGVTKTNGDV